MHDVGRNSPRVEIQLAHGGDSICQALYELSGGNPLALLTTLGLVAQKGYGIDDALVRLQDAAHSSDLYGFLFVEAVRDLSRNDRAVLIALAAYQFPESIVALVDATRLPNTAVQLALANLVKLSLVNDLDSGSYILHPLTRSYVRDALRQGNSIMRNIMEKLYADLPVYRRALRQNVNYARTFSGIHKDVYHMFDRLNEKWPLLDSSAAALRDLSGVPGPVKDPDAARMLNELANALRLFLDTYGFWDEQIRLAEWGYLAASALNDWRSAE